MHKICGPGDYFCSHQKANRVYWCCSHSCQFTSCNVVESIFLGKIYIEGTTTDYIHTASAKSKSTDYWHEECQGWKRWMKTWGIKNLGYENVGDENAGMEISGWKIPGKIPWMKNVGMKMLGWKCGDQNARDESARDENGDENMGN